MLGLCRPAGKHGMVHACAQARAGACCVGVSCRCLSSCPVCAGLQSARISVKLASASPDTLDGSVHQELRRLCGPGLAQDLYQQSLTGAVYPGCIHLVLQSLVPVSPAACTPDVWSGLAAAACGPQCRLGNCHVLASTRPPHVPPHQLHRGEPLSPLSRVPVQAARGVPPAEAVDGCRPMGRQTRQCGRSGWWQPAASGASSCRCCRPAAAQCLSPTAPSSGACLVQCAPRAPSLAVHMLTSKCGNTSGARSAAGAPSAAQALLPAPGCALQAHQAPCLTSERERCRPFLTPHAAAAPTTAGASPEDRHHVQQPHAPACRTCAPEGPRRQSPTPWRTWRARRCLSSARPCLRGAPAGSSCAGRDAACSTSVCRPVQSSR